METLVIVVVGLLGSLIALAIIVMLVGTVGARVNAEQQEQEDWEAWKSLEVRQPPTQRDTEAWHSFTVWHARYAVPRRFQWGRSLLMAALLGSLVGSVLGLRFGLRGVVAAPSLAMLDCALIGLVGLALAFPVWLGRYRQPSGESQREDWQRWRYSYQAQQAHPLARESFAVWDYLRRRGKL